MLNADQTVLTVIDMQGRLAAHVHEHGKILTRIQHIIKASQAFALPILWTEQAPDKIGESVESIRNLLSHNFKPIHKRSFSCYACPEYVCELQKIHRRQVLITGIETHVCIYQTVQDLQSHGYQVHLVADAVSSRQAFDHQLAIARMRDEGIIITTTEMAICELLKSADHPKFKEIISHIKTQ
ncbi:MAG: isochorismatase family protein [Candidatus Omnitrophica bacterium]|nr:isochorismatase family protein [Candidatus Omnitrophota bacterium]